MLDRPEVILSAAEGRHSKNKSFAKELRSKKNKITAIRSRVMPNPTIMVCMMWHHTFFVINVNTHISNK